MTVSPRRPNDQSPTATGRGDQVSQDDSQSEQMPPTLFRLPNLNAPMTGAASPQPPSTVPPSTVPGSTVPGSTIPATPVVGPTNGQPTSLPTSVEDPLVAPPRHEACTFGSEVRPASATSNVAVPTSETSSHSTAVPTAFPNIVPNDDGPAGRSWMEVTRQHGVVVVLLLIVVATAVFTGRDPNPPTEPTETGLAELQEQLDIDTGVAVDIPLPNHSHDLETGVASSVEQPVAPSPTDSVLVETPATNQAKNERRTAVAALQPPQTTASPTGIDLSSQRLVDGTASNATTAVEAKAVSSRSNDSVAVSDSDSDLQPPSLETLAENLAADPSTAANEVPATGGPAKTNTPRGINNWLQYLPDDSPKPSN